MAKDITSLAKKFAYNPKDVKGTSPRVIQKKAQPYKHHISELKYAHLSPLPDLLDEDLKLLFCGFNPGVRSAELGHRFAHRSNCFWDLIHDCGLVEDKLSFADDISMPKKYGIGFTELVMRPTKGVDEIPDREMRSNVPRLIELVNKQRPKVLCLVGRGIWDAISKTMKIGQDNFQWGEQTQNVFKCKLFVVPSTSGLVRIKYQDKLDIWKELNELVNK